MDGTEEASAQRRGRDADALTRDLLTYVLIPAWIVPGLLDWLWHRQTKIERTAGAHESLTHVLMAAEAGAGITLGLFCEIDAGVLAVMWAMAVLHEATVVWDVAYAAPRRKVAQHEHHTHSFLEALPFVTAALASFMSPAQARALAGMGPERPRFALRLSRTPPKRAAFAALAAGILLGVGPYAEELVRCLRVKPTLAPHPAHDVRDRDGEPPVP
ncbi:MAG TPA: hypothetical protein VE826_07545 [Dongiaceae bacterium]|nr:hypothetical protein [Dongiaceae bacterium]